MKNSMILTLGWIALSACHSNNTPLRATTLVSQADPQSVSKQAALNDQLKLQNLVFNSSYRTYSSQGFVQPCEPAFLGGIAGALDQMNQLDQQMQGPHYSGDALDFTREVADAKQSLTIINDSLKAYCSVDYAKQLWCLPNPQGIEIKINENVAGTGTLHPYLKLSAANPTELFILAGESKIRSTANVSPFVNISQVVSAAKLAEISVCLSQSILSDLAKAVATTASVAHGDSQANCVSLQEEWKNKHLRSGFESENQFCGLNP